MQDSYTKLGVSTRAAAGLDAMEDGLLPGGALPGNGLVYRCGRSGPAGMLPPAGVTVQGGQGPADHAVNHRGTLTDQRS
ncbi:MAG TPA: hypothetical protein VGW74_11890 [Propionibacteriaceae bacterium]|nr:hypothetical protein [Propionibacteriaceae bacterium]